MKEHYREAYEHSDARYLLPIIHDGVFHCAVVESVKGILSDGFITPNRGQFPPTYPQTLGSFGYSRGWISLFDFGSASEEECISQHHNWTQFFLFHGHRRVAFRLNRNKVAGKMIPNSARPHLGDSNYRSAIPFLESWYPEPIPVSFIDGCLITIPSMDGGEPAIIQCKLNELSKLLSKLVSVGEGGPTQRARGRLDSHR